MFNKNKIESRTVTSLFYIWFPILLLLLLDTTAQRISRNKILNNKCVPSLRHLFLKVSDCEI